MKKERNTRKPSRSPHKVHLPGFISDEEIGLGDAIKRVTYSFGIQPCAGCERRAAALNRWLVFSYSHRKTDFTEKCYWRVDVTEEFPFLVSGIAPYYDR